MRVRLIRQTGEIEKGRLKQALQTAFFIRASQNEQQTQRNQKLVIRLLFEQKK